MLNELEVFKIVITRLDSAGTFYMVIGSVAANFYTTPRMTRDIDMESPRKNRGCTSTPLRLVVENYSLSAPTKCPERSRRVNPGGKTSTD